MGSLRKAAVSLGVITLVLGAGATPAHSEFGFVTSWSLSGADPAAYPVDVATDSANNVYAALLTSSSSGLNSEIQKFTPDGDLITRWGSAGRGGSPRTSD